MKQFLLNSMLVLFSVIVLVGVGEVALRLFPHHLLPKGTYGNNDFDPDTNLKIHTGPTFYNNVRFVKKTPNYDGFMDINHALDKESDSYRVGFFGDSYVESVYVPLKDTFFRSIPTRIGNHKIETFAFGISGQGTLHSLINYRKFGRKYDHDLVEILDTSKQVTTALLKDFNREVTQDGKKFAVLFVPRSNEELEGKLSEDESWLPWLSQTCDELGITLLNPLPLLASRRANGEEIYSDHWNIAGHRAIAEFMTDYLAEHIQ